MINYEESEGAQIMPTCEECKQDFTTTAKRGTIPRFCSKSCKQKAYRKRIGKTRNIDTNQVYKTVTSLPGVSIPGTTGILPDGGPFFINTFGAKIRGNLSVDPKQGYYSLDGGRWVKNEDETWRQDFFLSYCNVVDE